MLKRTTKEGELFITEFSKEETTLFIKDRVAHDKLPSSITVNSDHEYLLNGKKTNVFMADVSPLDILKARIKEFTKLVNEQFGIMLYTQDVKELSILTGSLETLDGNKGLNLENPHLHTHLYLKVVTGENNTVSSSENFRRIFESLGTTTSEILKHVEYLEFIKKNNRVTYNAVLKIKS